MYAALVAGILSFFVTVLSIPSFIRFYQAKRIQGQQMHEDVKQHQFKAGTPTMGGVVFLTVALLVSLVLPFLVPVKMTSATYGILLILFVYGLVGFLDDFLKIFRQVNEGLKPLQKLSLQILGGLIFYFLHFQQAGGEGATTLHVLNWQFPLGALYIVFMLFWVVGFSNAVNLTDGIDGLASISVVISLSAYAYIAYRQGQMDILFLCVNLIGGLLGFFVFNHKPAKIFMGDVGSLALGGVLAVISIALHVEWTLLLIGLVYVLETSSVMIQVTYFKISKRKYGEGRRIFRMTPFHHHLELGGLSGRADKWSEWKVDAFLWSLGLLMSLVTLAILYL
ncbi:phospho-N-acetylmuramoyl-pentapeptide-transferase [Streptococcus sp. DD13]|uniref:phospho-N-acetylmuramoyl-pentapeptide- transferase n=1 Tax=Streptococcus sp. DD13 TaxID=1777881 RepID=UPI0007953DE3|nr:phospho-N-acetylmuramoyl-pentapeptide-transferase [Streptococcus sp. DD13]KXT78218.1 Phospho-N-acetylmuramoyl-pentapeptide-transferas e [Streptococcus sp. DD13]